MTVMPSAMAADGEPSKAGMYTVTPHTPAATERTAAAEPADSKRTEAGAPTSTVSTKASVAHGPGVELITGGGSTDGAARVGRLPILD